MIEGKRVLFTFIPFALILSVVLLFLPLFTIEIAPESKIQVVDCDDKPVSGVLVTQFWEHLRYSKTTHIDERNTDSNGVVEFPERNITISIGGFLSRRILGKSNLHHLADDKEILNSFGVENKAARYSKENGTDKLVLCND
jgi:hypothetical protein